MLIARRVLIFAALWLFFEGAISLIATCEGTYQPSDHAGRTQAKEYCSAFTGPVLASGWAFLYWLGHILEGYGEAVIAVFTIVLASATGLLWKATRDLVRGAEKTAERQLRAYVAIDDGVVFWDANDRTIDCIVRLKNFGQTPAYHFGMWLKVSVTNESIPFDRRGEANSKSLVGPGATVNASTAIQNLPEHVLPMLEAKQTGIYVWGRAEYVDAFGVDRFFEFRCSMKGPLQNVQFNNIHARGWGLSPDQSGYDAN